MAKIVISTLAIVLIFSLTIAASDTKNTDKVNVGKPDTKSTETKTNESQPTDAPQPSIPQMINYQGKLTDASGNPQDGNFDMTFKIFNALTGGTEYWTETQNAVTVTDGLFNVILGSVTLITNFPSGPNCYLEITVNGQLISPRQRIVSNGYSYYAGEAATVAGGPFLPLAGGTMTGPITNTGDPTIKMGKANFGTGNLNTGDATFVAGLLNTASGYTATVGGGQNNTASNTYTTVSGGVFNNAIAYAATVGGGYADTASGQYATVGGGIGNIASGLNATVGGGRGNTAINQSAVVCGGEENSASNSYASVGGGLANAASGSYATVGGGSNNTASGAYATIGGGDLDTAAGSGSYAVGNHSVVPSAFSLSAAFNGQAATASMQLRCGTLAKVGGSFTIDHPVDPNSKILNHYFVESPDMSNIYSGSAMLDANGRAEVRLPDYFDALNRNPRIQLTGVGTYEIFVAEKVNGNRFVIGGKPGTEVFWQVTGDRKDQSAEIIRTMMPVEQPKTGALAGRMLDDDFLVGCMKQLEEMGKAGQFNFRTAEGQRRFEEMKRQLLEHKNKNK